MKLIFFFSLILLFQIKSGAQLNFEKLAELEGASISYLVRDMSSGKLVASHDSNRVLAPASTLKLFTTAVALDQLGPEGTQKSSFYIHGKIENGTLLGDLIFDANHNVALLSYRYNRSLTKLGRALVKALKLKGITKIQGDIIVIEDIKAFNSIPRTWIWEDIGNYYGAGCRRTIINENMINLYFNSGEVGSDAELIKKEPDLPWTIINSEVKASGINRDLAYCFSRPGDAKISVVGTIPSNRNNFLVKAALPNPAGSLSMMLKKELKSQGIQVLGKSRVETTIPKGSAEFHDFSSPSVASIVRKTNSLSINIYAESLMNLVAMSNSMDKESRTDCLKRILGNNINVKHLKLFDGSGLSRFSAVSAKHTVDLLLWMNQHKAKKPFFNSFSIAGESGTLKSLLANTTAKGKIKGKSGSMEGVRAYAGTINTRKGENLVFSVIVNNYSVSNSAIKKILEKWIWDLWSEN